MRIKLWLLLPLIALGAQGANATELGLYLSDRTIQAKVATDSGLIGLQGGELSAAAFTNEGDDVLGSLGLSFSGQPTYSSAFTLGGGARLYGAELDTFDDNFIALGVGANASYQPLASTPLYLTGEFYFAPPITTAGDADNLVDFGLDVETNFTRHITGYIGYRLLRADLDDAGANNLDNNFHIGARFRF